MSMEAPPSLQELARQSLLRNLASPSPPLEDLPEHLFIPMFKEAFEGGHTETLRAMVQAWPFTCLPLGPLIKQFWSLSLNPRDEHVSIEPLLREKERREKPHVEVLKAVLNGINMVLAQKARPRCKLQVLDLRDVHGDFWSRGSSALPGAHSAEAVWEEQRARHAPRGVPEKPFTVLLDIVVPNWVKLDVLGACILKWAKKRRAVLHVCCEKLRMESSFLYQMQRVLHGVRLGCIRELEVDSSWTRDIMRKFVPYLPRMRNLQSFRFYEMSVQSLPSLMQNKWNSRIYAGHLGKMKSLRKLYIDDVFFLQGNLHRILRSLTPLKTLSLRSSPLRESDMEHLSQCPCTSQLKHLDLRDISMEGFSPEPLRVLLERLVSTLKTLVLERCGLTDAQLQALLPALSRCSQLRTLSCCGNRISMAVLEDLLRHTARLRHLRRGLYPVPRESQESAETSQRDRDRAELDPVGVKLMQVLRDINPSHEVRFCASFCETCYWCEFLSLEPSGSWKVAGEFRGRSCHRCFHRRNRS